MKFNLSKFLMISETQIIFQKKTNLGEIEKLEIVQEVNVLQIV